MRLYCSSIYNMSNWQYDWWHTDSLLGANAMNEFIYEFSLSAERNKQTVSNVRKLAKCTPSVSICLIFCYEGSRMSASVGAADVYKCHLMYSALYLWSIKVNLFPSVQSGGTYFWSQKNTKALSAHLVFRADVVQWMKTAQDKSYLNFITLQLKITFSGLCKKSFGSSLEHNFFLVTWGCGKHMADISLLFKLICYCEQLLTYTSSRYGAMLVFMWSGISGHLANASPIFTLF